VIIMAWLTDTTGRHTLTTEYDAPQNTYEPVADLDNKTYGNSSTKIYRQPGNVTVVLGGSLEAADSDDWIISTYWTLQLWFRSPGTGNHGEEGLISQFDDYDGSDTGWNFRLNFDNGNVEWIGSFTSQSSWNQLQYGPGTLDDDAWHHICIVRNNTWWSLYLDGIRQSYIENNRTVKNVNCPLSIGKAYYTARGSYYNTKNRFNGWIDDVHIEKDIARYVGSSFTPVEQYETEFSVLLAKMDVDLYDIGGTLSHDSRIIVMDESSRDIEYDAVKTAGAYSIVATDQSEKSVFAVRESDGKVLGYGRVIPATT
jgi:hypothetical protein